MPEPAFLPIRRWQFNYFMPARPDDPLYHHLRDTLAALYDQGLLAEIDGDELNFTPVIGIDGARTVDHRQSLFQRHTAARPDLRFETHRQRNRDTRWNERPLQRRQANLAVNVRKKIHPR